MTIQNIADLTPLMRQYFAIKQQYSHALLLFQVGDFYELFFDDAKQAAAFLGIALTKRGKVNGDPIPLCGVPVHALDHYLVKLVKGGFKVAICDQLEEAKPGKVVERGVTRMLTPGTLTDTKLLDEKSASYLFSFFWTQDQWGLLFAELLTAQLFATVLPPDSQKSLEAELIRFFPDEIIISKHATTTFFETYFKKLGYCITPISLDDTSQFEKWVAHQFATDIQMQLGKHNAVSQALGNFYTYLAHTQQTAIHQFKNVQWYAPEDFLVLDFATQKNLELVRNSHDASRKDTLFQVLDGALTPMGSRMIKKWILRPLVKKDAIIQRQNSIQSFVTSTVVLQQAETMLKELGDIERVIGRILLGRALIHDFLHLKNVVKILPQLCHLLNPMPDIIIKTVVKNLSNFDQLYQLLQDGLNEDITKEWLIKAGFNQELDQLRELSHCGAQKILALESKEQQLTGINSLKIRYNQLYGYYIEVTKTHTESIPARYIQQQTLVGRQRYITHELQQLQNEINSAQVRVAEVEKKLFEQIKYEVQNHSNQLRKLSHALANLDALCGLALVAYHNRYVRPSFNDQNEILIEHGRNPIIERIIGHNFIPNDTCLNDQRSTWIITGPNMGGKSTYLRQVALICVMAQIGSYVPAQTADLPILDRIFTRIGAGDNLSQGKSTFLVEMEETAAICTQATARSLVILDEVGRGTSTLDGLALAQAVIEYIHTQLYARCLFATHYHELTVLPNKYSGILNYYAASIKTHRGIEFLYTIIPGVADESFGIEVAKLAQLPPSIIEHAQMLLGQFKMNSPAVVVPITDDSYTAEQKMQQLHNEMEKLQKKLLALQKIDYDNLSPRAAFDILWNLKKELG